MSFIVDNAVILAAGFSSRFAPLCAERPKALIPVRGEVLIERQICQLREAGVKDVIVVTGYKKEAFEYLRDKLGVILVENPEYARRNNHSSIRWPAIWATATSAPRTIILSKTPLKTGWTRLTTRRCMRRGRHGNGA